MQVLQRVQEGFQPGPDRVAAFKGQSAEIQIEHRLVGVQTVLVVALHHGQLVQVGQKRRQGRHDGPIMRGPLIRNGEEARSNSYEDSL
jgi:hypothetical protein